MLTKTNKRNSTSFLLRIFLTLPLILCVFIITVNAQRNDVRKLNPKANLPVWHDYKGVAIGMTAPEVYEKLGVPTSENEGGLFYLFTEVETVQVLFDENKKVRTVSVIFTAEFPNPPKFVDVFGKTVADETKADGSAYKMIRYEDAGYWVSYNRMAGEQAMVIIVMQKL